MLYLRSFKRFILISLALLGLSIPAINAADVAFVGNGSTSDNIQATHLDWLDLTGAADLSHYQVSALLADPTSELALGSSKYVSSIRTFVGGANQ